MALLATQTRHDLAKEAFAAVPACKHLDRQIDRSEAALQLDPRFFYQVEGDLQDEVWQFGNAPKIAIRCISKPYSRRCKIIPVAEEDLSGSGTGDEGVKKFRAPRSQYPRSFSRKLALGQGEADDAGRPVYADSAQLERQAAR